MENKIGITCDMRVIAKILGQRTYKNNTLQVAVKELLQNSYDACKPMQKGEINIILGRGINPKNDEKGTFLLITDNGVGMTSETIKNVYLCMGGTLKEGLSTSQKSGGFGIAKIQYLTNSEAIEIRSWRDSIKTEVITNAEELFTNNTVLNSVNEPSHENGTEIKVWYPDDMDIYFPLPCYERTFGFDKPCLGYPDIHIYYTCDYFPKEEVCILDKKYTNKSKISFEWGDIEIYYGPKEYKPSNSEIDTIVLSAGLYQFEYCMYDSERNGIKFPTIINILPKVDAHDLKYPINNSREGFSVSIQDDVDTIERYMFDIQKVLNSEMIKRMYENKIKLSYIPVDGKSNERISVRPYKNIELDDSFAEMLNYAFMHCDNIYKKKEVVEKAESQSVAAKSETSSRETLSYVNQTYGEYNGSTEVFSKIISAVVDCVEDISYSKGLSFGIIIKKNVHGELAKGEINCLYVNPLFYVHNHDLWIYNILNTVIHELAHTEAGYHGEYHNSVMMQVAEEMIEKEQYNKLSGKLSKIWNDYRDYLYNFSHEFDNSKEIPCE